MLSHGNLFVRVHNIVVLDYTLKRSLELGLIFVVHSDTHGQLWLSVIQNGEISHSSDETGVLDLSEFSIFSETTGSDRGIGLSLCKANGLLRHVLSRLKVFILVKVLLIRNWIKLTTRLI